MRFIQGDGKSAAKVWGSAIKSIQQLDIHKIFLSGLAQYIYIYWAVTPKPRVISLKNIYGATGRNK